MINSVLLLLAVTANQTHTPSATVSGDIVTVDADIAALPAAITEYELLQGRAILNSTGNVAASADGVSPIVWRLGSGQHQVVAYGFPDDRENPHRIIRTLDVEVIGPTRQQQIAAAVKRFTLALYESGQAQAELQGLNPSRQELIDALTLGAP